MLGGEVVGLGVVVLHVEELPPRAAEGREPPVALAYGASVLVLPVHGALGVPLAVAAEQGRERASLGAERLDGVAVVGGGVGGVGELYARGHDVEELARLAVDGALSVLGYALGPVYDGGGGGAAVELRGLPVAEGRVDGSCPARVQVVVRELVARCARVVYDLLAAARAVVAVEVAYGVVLRRCSVVGGKYYDGVVEGAVVLQFLYDASHALIYAVYHGGVYLHVGGLERLVGLILPGAA